MVNAYVEGFTCDTHDAFRSLENITAFAAFAGKSCQVVPSSSEYCSKMSVLGTGRSVFYEQSEPERTLSAEATSKVGDVFAMGESPTTYVKSAKVPELIETN
jgi:hypothetical protein